MITSVSPVISGSAQRFLLVNLKPFGIEEGVELGGRLGLHGDRRRSRRE